ncbi:hypothetical protein SRHO_G00083150 [Serrasalmus rhombeus]
MYLAQPSALLSSPYKAPQSYLHFKRLSSSPRASERSSQSVCSSRLMNDMRGMREMAGEQEQNRRQSRCLRQHSALSYFFTAAAVHLHDLVVCTHQKRRKEREGGRWKEPYCSTSSASFHFARATRHNANLTPHSAMIIFSTSFVLGEAFAAYRRLQAAVYTCCAAGP